MCGQSMFNSLSGGLLAPRGFLILLSKDWKLLILPLLYQGDVFRNKWAANCLQRIRTGKTTDHSILHRQRNPPQWPTMCTTGLLPTDNFQEQHALPRGFSLVSLCPTSTMHFWAHSTALDRRRGSPLTSDTCWAAALSWPHPSSNLSRPSTMLVEVHLWRSPALALPLNLLLPCSTVQGVQSPSPSHTAETSQVTLPSLFSQQRLLVWEHTYQHEGGLHKLVPQESNVVNTVLQYIYIYFHIKKQTRKVPKVLPSAELLCWEF